MTGGRVPQWPVSSEQWANLELALVCVSFLLPHSPFTLLPSKVAVPPRSWIGRRRTWFQFHFATSICLPLHIRISFLSLPLSLCSFYPAGSIVGQGYGEKTRRWTAVPHSAKRSTARLIRDDRLRECIPHVLRWSCLVSRGFINWQRHAPAQQDGVTLFKSRIYTCVYRPGSLPCHCPFGLVCLIASFQIPAPH